LGAELTDPVSDRLWWAGLVGALAVYLHNTLPHLTMMPRVNVDEPWLMERAYQVMRTGIPSQPMLGLRHAYLLQVGYGYLLAGWMELFGVGLAQARLLGVALGLGILTAIAWIGRRTIGSVAGLGAALFLALDSNFLGGVRNARTDIPSVFFVVLAFAAYLAGRERARARWFVLAGAFLGLAVLCHGNAFWGGFILAAWFVLDYGFRALIVPYGYALASGVALTFGPYVAVLLTRWHEVQEQVGNFASDRVPGWRPSFIAHEMMLEPQRYRGWYFGLVTSAVPHPLLWVFQLLTAVGVIALIARSLWPDSRRGPSTGDSRGAVRVLILVLGSVVIFAGFINNKVPVYMPHLLIGFALAAGVAVNDALALIPAWTKDEGPGTKSGRTSWLAALFLAGYGLAGVVYYEKWYSTVQKSELVPYEETVATLRALVPAGPKYLFASPQFWTPFHDEMGTTFYSYAAAQPSDVTSSEWAVKLSGVSADRPVYLVVDELQWLPELVGVSSSTAEWQRSWIDFIERKCHLDGVALGTAHGTLALYQCALTVTAGQSSSTTASSQLTRSPRVIGGATEFTLGPLVLSDTTTDLARWTRYDDPRRTSSERPEVHPVQDGLEIDGTGWPGIVHTFAASPGENYLVRTNTRHTRDGDLLYLGMWQQPQVRSLAGASSSGIPAPLIDARWFPRDRAFRATTSSVRILVYSEAPETDFVISSLDIYRLVPRTP